MCDVLMYPPSGQDVMEMSSVVEVKGWEDLAGWLDVDEDKIRTKCVAESDQPQCYRRRLVKLYCDSSGKSSQQVAEDMARIYEDKMENKRLAKELRQLTFSEL